VRKQVSTYVTEEEFKMLHQEAEEHGISMSRYIKEKLVSSGGRSGATISDARLAASEKRIIESLRTAITNSARPLAQQLTTLLTMLDQFALSVLIHTPEIPESQRKQAIVAGERRHRGWRAEVEEHLKQMEPPRKQRTERTGEEDDDAA
jgi:hypothetical protein